MPVLASLQLRLAPDLGVLVVPVHRGLHVVAATHEHEAALSGEALCDYADGGARQWHRCGVASRRHSN